MSTPQYVFTGSQGSREFERLHAIEQVFDPASQKRIQVALARMLKLLIRSSGKHCVIRAWIPPRSYSKVFWLH